MTLHVDFDTEWDEYAKSAVFFTSEDKTVYEMILVDGECIIPREVLVESCILYIGVRGVCDAVVKTSTLVKYKIEEGAPAGTGTTVEPTPDVYQQILTEFMNVDKKIAQALAKNQQITPLFANSIDECTDTTKLYVLPDGYIYAYMRSTTEETVTITDVIESTAENPAHNGQYLNKGSLIARDGTFVTPYIDLSKYTGQITLKVKGTTCLSDTAINYSALDFYDENKTYLARIYMTLAEARGTNVVTALCDSLDKVSVNGDTTTFIIDLPRIYTGKNVSYIRFTCGTYQSGSTWETSEISISRQETQTVTKDQWTSLGIQFVASGMDDETLAKIATLNNEGASPSIIKLLPSVVLDFYNAEVYSDDDYSTSHLEKITYPCRADIPVPYTVKWNHNENAMRTTVAVDTKAIGTVNRFTMRTYDATGVDCYPIYNLLPNTKYYYKVNHILSDGSIVEAKNGNFTTSNETIRLIYIDGTQNVRDLGGWTGLSGKKVKYGKIFRGATFSDSSYPGLMLTGKGRIALGELKIQAELNLGAADTETSVSATCSYHKIGYSNYATAITDATAKANFKNALEKIVAWLNESTPRNIYMHCQGGCDRTGTLAFQLLGLLGVSESDLAKEYELSSFSDIGLGRLRTTTMAVDTYDYVGMVEAIKAYGGNTITDKFYNFATTGCGISADTIASFRNLMLG